MLRQVDESLRLLVQRDGDLPAGTEVVFDAPTTDWAAARSTPTLDLYLYDIREDLDRSSVGVLPRTEDGGRVVERHPPPRWFCLSYLVTAWTARPEDEHALLDGVLTCLVRHARIPAGLLPDTPAELGYPAVLTVGLPPPEDRSLSDVWSALGGQLKPSLDVVVTAPVDTGRGRPVEADAPTRATVAGGFTDRSGTERRSRSLRAPGPGRGPAGR